MFRHVVHDIATVGWVVQWKASGQSIKRQMMFGLMDTMDHFSLRRFQLTPSTTSHSALWIGSFGPIEVVAVTTAGLGNLYFTTHVKIRNIGPTMLTDLYCM